LTNIEFEARETEGAVDAVAIPSKYDLDKDPACLEILLR
jgi:hypothetical protein